ncbi:MAG: hypothetical protein ACRC10_02245 [Thermoguttaceae bacterium]
MLQGVYQNGLQDLLIPSMVEFGVSIPYKSGKFQLWGQESGKFCSVRTIECGRTTNTPLYLTNFAQIGQSRKS